MGDSHLPYSTKPHQILCIPAIALFFKAVLNNHISLQRHGKFYLVLADLKPMASQLLFQ